MVGQVIGRLTVIEDAGNRGRKAQWLCRCTCGNMLVAVGTELRNGSTKSCGCLRIENFIQRSTTHNLSKDPLFKTWIRMRERCLIPTTKHFDRWGGRGITICEEWKDVAAFIQWARTSYIPGLSLDRINNDGNYSPDNCRWVNATVQNRNRSNNIFITYRGEKRLLAEVAENTGLKYGTLFRRYKRGDISEERLLRPTSRREVAQHKSVRGGISYEGMS